MSMELSYDMKNFQRNMQCISEKKKVLSPSAFTTPYAVLIKYHLIIVSPVSDTW